METFGKLMRKRRKQLGWTQRDLANKLNMSHQTIMNYEREYTIPNIYMASDIAQVMGCTLDELLKSKKDNEVKK